jgi:nickel-dependent lactate racemase
MAVVDVPVGRSHWTLSVQDTDLIPLASSTHAPVRDARAAVVEALDHPVRFEPFRRALTPDDRIALVVDESLPRLPELIAGVLEYLAGAGIPPSAVTAISPAGAVQHWINDLPDTMSELQTEVHRPGDRNKLSYLAATREGHRIYLNRTLVDADQAIVLSGRGYDPLLGYSGGVGSVYPGLADADSVRNLVPKLSPQSAPDGSWPVHTEANEVAWLLGSPFFVQVIEGAGDEIDGVVAGFADTAAEGADRLNDRWRTAAGEAADTVVVTLSGNPERHDFAALARAAATGARAVKPGGSVIILSEADPEMGRAVDVLRRTDEPPEAVKLLFREKPVDAPSAVQWAWAAGRARLYLASEIRPSTVEEMFATPLSGPKDVQSLLDAGGRTLIVPDAHKSWITVP